MFDGPPAGARLSRLAVAVRSLGEVTSDRDRLAALRTLEELKAVAAATQVRLTADFAASRASAAQAEAERTRELARSGTFEDYQAAREGERSRRSVAAEIGFARRISPWRAERAVAVATALVEDLPHTYAALGSGVLSEWRASIVVTETTHLVPQHRRLVDAAVIAADGALEGVGDQQLTSRVKAAAYRLDPEGAVRRARAAAGDRRVTMRPAPDTMCRVSALLPAADAVATYAALSAAADTARAAGEERGRGQVMADTLVSRVTGREVGQVDIEVQVVLPDTALLGVDDAPGRLVGYGPVPAGWTRDLLACRRGSGLPPRRVWLRRLYAAPETGALVAMESDRRCFEGDLRRIVLARDGDTCRTPWCDAPIRHIDHVVDHRDGGPTSLDDGQGLCERCNHTKQHPGWRLEVDHPPDDARHPRQRTTGRSRHVVRWTTPTGLTVGSVAPALPTRALTTAVHAPEHGSSRPGRAESKPEHQAPSLVETTIGHILAA